MALLTLSVSLCASAQSERDRLSVDAFVARKATQSASRLEALALLGRGGNYESVLQCAREQPEIKPLGYPTSDPAQRAALLSTFQSDVVLMTLAAGIPLEVCSSNATKNALGASARMVRGDSSPADLVHLSDFVVVAVARPSPIRVDGDGFRSSTGFVVVDTLKGDLRRGNKFVVRQMSGKNADGSMVRVSTDPVVKFGSKYLIVGSRAGYEVEAAGYSKQKQAARKDIPVAMAYVLADPDSGEANNIRLAASPL